MRVNVYRARHRVFDGTASQVVLPGEEGEVAVLQAHAPMLCSLARGIVRVDEATFLVRGGVARVDRNTVTIIAS